MLYAEDQVPYADNSLVKKEIGSRRKSSQGRSSFYLLAATLVLVALTGGGSRSDISSLLLLRPLSAMVLAYALVFHGPTLWKAYPLTMRFVVVLVALMVFQLVPLPPILWTMLPGREPIVEAMNAAGMALPWLPVSIAPADSWNALFSLMLPISVLMLALSIKQDELILLLRCVIVGLLLSGLLGLLQILGSSDSPLYTYRLTNRGSAVGLFANRNHQAMALACIFPLLALHISLLRRSDLSTRFNKRLAMAAAILIIPLMLVTGSRAGLLSLIIALIGAAWIYCEPQIVGRVVRNRGLSPVQIFILGAVVTGLLAVTLFASRAEAIDRLLESDVTTSIRAQALPIIVQGIWTYFPVGSGFGTFVPAYQQLEPENLLNATYLNHAHNEFAEMLMTGGLAGLAIMLVLVAGFVVAVRGCRQSYASITGDVTSVVLQRTGLVIIFLFVMGGVSDYPMRTPLVAALTALAVAAVPVGRQGQATRHRF